MGCFSWYLRRFEGVDGRMYAILVAGLPAAGKTRFAEWLSARRKLPLISKDEIKERLFDTLGFRSREEKVRLDVAAFELLCGFAEREMQAGRDLLIENNFEDSSTEPMKELLEKYGCNAITVRFQGNIETIYSRFLEREHSPDRHPGHIRNDRYPADDDPPSTSLTLEQFADGMEKRGFARFSLGRLIEVDATDLARVDYEAIERRIDELLGARYIGCCGHDCLRCVTYLAAQDDDDELRRRSQAFYRNAFGVDLPLGEFNCDGCRSQKVFALCRECPFRGCCAEHGVERCDDCPDFPCDDIADYREKFVNKCNQVENRA